MTQLKDFISVMLKRTKKFTFLDYGILKTCVFFIGILAGAYFYEFFLEINGLIWAIALTTYAWVVYILFVKYKGSAD